MLTRTDSLGDPGWKTGLCDTVTHSGIPAMTHARRDKTVSPAADGNEGSSAGGRILRFDSSGFKKVQIS